MLTKPNDVTPTPRRVLLLGATGTIGRATARALIARGYEVVCIVRASVSDLSDQSRIFRGKDLSGVELRYGQVASAGSLNSLIRREDGFDAIVSCLASRTGAPKDAWAIDFQAHADVLAVAKDVGISHIVLLSAICVQKPRLEFQKAKLAFEKLLMNSGVTYSIVRPTAYFKSLSGQIERVRQGKPFLLFGSGELTSCKPISNMDPRDEGHGHRR
ncbi:MAG: NAD(P)H-binding protein [Pseudomonadota bacterium]